MRVLVVAPHPDDEILGCGGTILKHKKNGDEVSICYATKPWEPIWSKEYIKNRTTCLKKLKECLKVEMFFGNFNTTTLSNEKLPEIISWFNDVVKEVDPQIIYIPSMNDIHQDHMVLAHSALIAAKPTGCSAKTILTYETPSETEFGFGFVPKYYIDITKHLEDKLDLLLLFYKEEIKEYPHTRSTSSVIALARKRGSEVNIPYAESFEVVRMIR